MSVSARQKQRQDRQLERLLTMQVSRPDYDAQARAVSTFLGDPGLRSFWPLSGYDSAGDATDLGGLAHHLTYNGNPQYDHAGLIPYLNFDGTGDYLSHVDHADFDITGGEAFVAGSKQGLTVKGWFQTSVPAGQQGLITKYAAAPQSSYRLQCLAGVLDFSIYDGAANRTVANTEAIVADTWTFAAGRWDRTASTLDVWHNEVQVSLGIPAGTITNSTTALCLAGFATGILLLTGYMSLWAIYATAQSDAQIASTFQNTRAMFGV